MSNGTCRSCLLAYPVRVLFYTNYIHTLITKACDSTMVVCDYRVANMKGACLPAAIDSLGLVLYPTL